MRGRWTGHALSLAYDETGQPVKAESTAREMLQLAGNDPHRSETAEARRTLGLALEEQQRYAETLLLLEAAYDSYSKHAPNSLFVPKLRAGLAETRAALAKASPQKVK